MNNPAYIFHFKPKESLIPELKERDVEEIINHEWIRWSHDSIITKFFYDSKCRDIRAEVYEDTHFPPHKNDLLMTATETLVESDYID